ncbi:MAG: DUF975 family protein [Oscillospiraceae bacterium]|nr:DUF975 family protein [Oscillospiraceae bacterium]
MWKISDMKKKGKDALRRNRWKAIAVSLVFMSIFGVTTGVGSGSADLQEHMNELIVKYGVEVTFVATLIASLIIFMTIAVTAVIRALIFNPLEVGVHKFRINAVKGTGNISDMGFGYDTAYKRNAITLLFRDIYLFLWSLLFLIPGIIKAYEYLMVPYILADNPDISQTDAFRKSKEMMKGNKGKAFLLDLSFIPWYILGGITCGILCIFYVWPYHHLTKAALYEKLK